MNDKTGLVLFTASWASEPCSSVKEILSALKSRQKVSLFDFEVIDESEDSAVFDDMGIEVVPCLVRFVAGREVGRVEGSEPENIISFIENSHSKEEKRGEMEPKALIEESSVKITDLVKRSKLMLFIKGTPLAPRCGFTSQLIKLLSDHELRPAVHYDTFDILSDERIRQELKEWAQWPTYPQVYWCGDLIGGLDILKEMFATGQMNSILDELKATTN